MHLRRRDLSPDVVDGDPLLDRIYRGRGITSADQLNHKLAALLKPDFADLDKAVDLLVQARAQQPRIVIAGDYDCDGATATSVMVKGLRLLGYETPLYLIPDRFDLGYGLSVGLAQQLAAMNPDIVITVDSGISSVSGVETLKALRPNCKIIITDHHLPGPVLPAADAVINPNRIDCPFPSKNLAGVGVAFYLLIALRTALASSADLRELLPLVALGTVSDMVSFDQTNRILVNAGLGYIRHGYGGAGLDAIFDIANRRFAQARAEDLGFAIGPRLNAAGRLERMELGVECLLAQDRGEAKNLAEGLNSINQDRQALQGELLETAVAKIPAILPSALCLFDQSFHEGIVGLIASRIKDRYHRPCVVFAPGSDGMLKGSARSVRGVHIRDVLEKIATEHGLYDRFGGHAMAAGLTLPVAHLEKFNTVFDQEVMRLAPETEALALSDGSLSGEQWSLETAQILERAGPFGAGFASPQFDDQLYIQNAKPLSDGRHYRLNILHPDGAMLEGIWFDVGHSLSPGTIHCVYALDINRFAGRERPQIRIIAAVGRD